MDLFGISARLVVCKLWLNNAIPLVLFMTSSVNLSFLCYERCLAITKPLKKHNNSYIKERFPLTIVLMWIIGIAIPSPLIIFSKIKNFHCIFFAQMRTYEVNIIFVDGLLAFIVPGAILVWTQYRMISKLKRSMLDSKMILSQDSNKNLYRQANRNLLKSLLAVVGFYMVCWPLHVISMALVSFGFGDIFGIVARVTMLFVVSNACVKPFIYALTYQEFKCNMRKLLACICKYQYCS